MFVLFAAFIFNSYLFGGEYWLQKRIRSACATHKIDVIIEKKGLVYEFSEWLSRSNIQIAIHEDGTIVLSEFEGSNCQLKIEASEIRNREIIDEFREVFKESINKPDLNTPWVETIDVQYINNEGEREVWIHLGNKKVDKNLNRILKRMKKEARNALRSIE